MRTGLLRRIRIHERSREKGHRNSNTESLVFPSSSSSSSSSSAACRLAPYPGVMSKAKDELKELMDEAYSEDSFEGGEEGEDDDMYVQDFDAEEDDYDKDFEEEEDVGGLQQLEEEEKKEDVSDYGGYMDDFAESSVGKSGSLMYGSDFDSSEPAPGGTSVGEYR